MMEKSWQDFNIKIRETVQYVACLLRNEERERERERKKEKGESSLCYLSNLINIRTIL